MLQYEFLDASLDLINDGLNEAGNPRTDTAFDLSDRLGGRYSRSEVQLIRIENTDDLWITSISYFADGFIDAGVKIENCCLGGNDAIELLQTNDGTVFNIAEYAPSDVAA